MYCMVNSKFPLYFHTIFQKKWNPNESRRRQTCPLCPSSSTALSRFERYRLIEFYLADYGGSCGFDIFPAID